jgi:transposase, IS6 family
VTAPGTALVFAGFRFPREVIWVAVGWCPRSGLSCREVGELLAEGGSTAGHVTVDRWVRWCTAEVIEAARPGRRVPGNRWFAGETCRRAAGRWASVDRAVAQQGQVIDVVVSAHRGLAAARRLFSRALRTGSIPAEVTTGRAAVYPRVIDELIPSARHTAERYANAPAEGGHGRRTARLRPVRGRTRHRSARLLAVGHAFAPNLRRGRYGIAMDVPACHRLRIAFDDLATMI